MPKRESLEKMQERARKLKKSLASLFRSRQPSAQKLDNLGKQLSDLNVEIAAAKMQRERATK
jgi:septal ring factor EnvC (AmiA/AmiB activator)